MQLKFNKYSFRQELEVIWIVLKNNEVDIIDIALQNCYDINKYLYKLIFI